MKRTILSIVCLWLVVAACSTKSQFPSGPSAQRYVSNDGQFSIDLAVEPNLTELAAVEGKSSVGRLFSWKIDGSMYTVGYTDWVIEPLNEAEILRISSQNVIKGATSKGGALVVSEAINVSGCSGVESRLLISNNIFLYRHIAKGNRLYLLSARWPESENGERQKAVLDSFEIDTPCQRKS